MGGKTNMVGLILAGKAAEAAAAKDHRLAAYMVDGKHPLTKAAFDGIMRNLARCADRQVTMRTVDAKSEEGAAMLRNAAAGHQARLTFQDIPAGFYATESATGNNDYDYWKVTVGKKSGFRDAKRVVGGGTTQQPKLIEIPQAQRVAALRAIIRTGIGEARALYAEKEERCTECGRQLTDETSRAHGMGPDCWENQGS